jgi:phage gp29-like protein
MPSLSDKLKTFFARQFVPRRRRAELSAVHGEPNRASLVSVDDLHVILGEAEQGRTKRLFALYRDIIQSDPHIWGSLATRKMAVLNKPPQVLPVDKNNPDDVRAADECRALLDRVPNLILRFAEMLDATLYPVSVSEKCWKPAEVKGLRFDLASLKQQDPQLLDYSTGCMRLEGVDSHTRMANNTFEPVDTHEFIVHRGHVMSTPDNWGGAMRTLLFWWLFSTQNRDWWTRFLDRYGAPFMVGHFPTGDDESRYTLEAAFSAASRLFGLAISDETKVEVHEVSASHGDAFAKYHETAEREKTKLILGQTLSSIASPTGIGGGASGIQGEVRKDIEAFDGLLLGQTVRDQLFAQFLEINALPGRPPTLTFGTEDAGDAKAFAETLKTAADAGWEATDDAAELVGQKLGYPVQRKAASASSAGPALFDASTKLLAPGGVIAQVGAPELAQAFRGHLAPIRRMLRESTSAEDFETQVRTFYADWKPGQIARIVEEGLTAYAVNGAAAKPGT